ncbi:MAG: hypothetical protein ABIS67_08555 [Candidatus Eisenbacteria bacterium]
MVGALPSHLGFAAMCAAIEARRDMVDVSFCAEAALHPLERVGRNPKRFDAIITKLAERGVNFVESETVSAGV